MARVVQELLVCDMDREHAGQVETWTVRASDGHGATLDLCPQCGLILAHMVERAAPGRELRPKTARPKNVQHRREQIDLALLPDDLRQVYGLG
jgi:hypothetical protein